MKKIEFDNGDGAASAKGASSTSTSISLDNQSSSAGQVSNEWSGNIYENSTNFANAGSATVINHFYNTPNSSEVADKANETNAALEKLSRLQDKYKEKDVVLLGLETPRENIPIVHPKIVEANVIKTDDKEQEPYNPSTEHCSNIKYKKEISYKNLINRVEESSFVTLIGQPGSGKSTISKRIVQENTSRWFLLKFMEMNEGLDHKLTLQQLLLSNEYPELTEKECSLIFKWMLENDDKCFFILEGYDQSEWKLNKHANKRSCNEPQTVQSLISNLCHKRFFPRAHILLTSRPHSILSIPTSIRSNCTVLLQDLALDDMKRLFFVFAGTDALQVWDKLCATAPQLISTCLNPLMLQLIVKACLSSTVDISKNTTMTRVFATILADLRHSDHARHEDINIILDQLSELAFNATLKSTVVMAVKELQAVGLDMATAQDLVIAHFMHRTGFSKVFEGDAKLYFCHQTFQEYFTARYIGKLMSFDEFKKFVKTELFNSHWIVVRRFLFGILFDLKETSENFETKAELLKAMLVKKMDETPMTRDLIDICHDVRESNDEDIMMKTTACFPTNARLEFTSLSASDAHAFSCVIRKVSIQIEELSMYGCDLTTESFRYISDAISHMSGSIERIYINENNLSCESIDDIIKLYGKTKSKLRMRKCFDSREEDNRDANEEEKFKLQRALNQLPSSTLEVDVEWLGGNNHVILRKEN